MSDTQPIKLAILWHMHQPDYRDFNSGSFILPWVRLHALKDYLDMPLMASQYEKVKVTFNLVPALIDQLNAYINGAVDPHLELTQKDASDLTDQEKILILHSFFSAPTETMIKPHKRYYELFKKVNESKTEKILAALFTADEIRDLQVWSNLVWIDPMFRTDGIVKTLFEKQKHFTEDDKQSLVKWQIEHLKKIIPTYKELYEQNKIDISFTPYFHPILPLVCDNEIAKEALPNIKLPKKPFSHPEDAFKQIEMSKLKFQEIFGKPLAGMWPSEGSVSEEALRLIADNEIKWVATDEEILANSLKKSNQQSQDNFIHKLYQYNGVKFFFRDHALSDRIGFVYSGMHAKDAVNDFFEHIYALRDIYKDKLDQVVIPIILDGENAWEYFDNDGYEFLDLFYKKLSTDPLVEAVGMTEYAEIHKATELKSLFAGSWINHNFKIWIGHDEDNQAWDLLANARETLVSFATEKPDYPKEKIEKAWQQIYIAEGSDWCWWYGDEHQSAHNKEFDEIYRNHLKSMYELLGMKPPQKLSKPIFTGVIQTKASMPEDYITPVIDGKRTHYYEWSQAGQFQALDSGGAMHSVSKMIKLIKFGFDEEMLYLMLEFDKNNLKLTKKSSLQIEVLNQAKLNIDIPFEKYHTTDDKNVVSAYGSLLEIAVKREYLFEPGHGDLEFLVHLVQDDNRLETIPESEPIVLKIPQKDQELFWST